MSLFKKKTQRTTQVDIDSNDVGLTIFIDKINYIRREDSHIEVFFNNSNIKLNIHFEDYRAAKAAVFKIREAYEAN
jgi:hypothetical protein